MVSYTGAMPINLKFAFEDLFEGLLPKDAVSRHSQAARQQAAATIREAEANGESLFGQYAAAEYKVTQEGFSRFLEEFLSAKTGKSRG